MHWNQISFEVNKQQADLVSEVLMGLGSISISYSDSQDNAIFEPPVGETPLWESPRQVAQKLHYLDCLNKRLRYFQGQLEPQRQDQLAAY